MKKLMLAFGVVHAMIAALFADLFILRPTAMLLLSFAEKIKAWRSQPGRANN